MYFYLNLNKKYSSDAITEKLAVNIRVFQFVTVIVLFHSEYIQRQIKHVGIKTKQKVADEIYQPRQHDRCLSSVMDYNIILLAVCKLQRAT
jgi:hypothetical protein